MFYQKLHTYSQSNEYPNHPSRLKTSNVKCVHAKRGEHQQKHSELCYRQGRAFSKVFCNDKYAIAVLILILLTSLLVLLFIGFFSIVITLSS